MTGSAFTMLEVAADWQEPMIAQRITWPSIARADDYWTRGAAHRHRQTDRHTSNENSISVIQRLAVLNLDSLHVRRIKADLLLCYKMINNLVDVDVSAFFTLSDCRSNGRKLKKLHCCSTRDANFFLLSCH